MSGSKICKPGHLILAFLLDGNAPRTPTENQYI
jgi:hypothetical protein